MSVPAIVGVAGVALAAALSVLLASGALEASARASGAADAAALAAADAALGWIEAEPCALAREVAEAAAVQLDGCDVDRLHGQVRISVSVQTIFGRVGARARAAPPVA